MDELPPDPSLPLAIRVFTTRATKSDRADLDRDWPLIEALIFDTETATGPTQQLKIGVWRLYIDRHGAANQGVTCVEEGLFYADDLPVSDPNGYAEVRRYRETHADAEVAAGFPTQLRLMSASDWLQKRFFRYGYQHRNRCRVVGFNLGFDLGRLASYWGEAGDTDRGGFSIGLWGAFDENGRWHDRRYHPRLLMRAIDPRRTLFGWGHLVRGDEDAIGGRGNFVDLHTLVFALTDENHSLESACNAFGDPYEKAEVEYGVVDQRSLDYARDDVRQTARLYRSCLDELRQHTGVELDPARLFSPATIGVQYLAAFGVDHPLARFMADPQTTAQASELMVDGKLHARVVGWATGGFFGGRAEARLPRTPVPVTLVDATSMYPTVNANLGTWELLTADRMEIRDTTEEVRALLSSNDLLNEVLRRETWANRIGVTLVELDHPDGDILPVRAFYDPAARDPGIGINPLTYPGRLWYLLPDVIAAKLLGGRTPTIARSMRLVGVDRQPGLRPVRLRGGRVLDPYAVDPFAAMVEERQRIKADPSLPEAERKRLDRFLKITANATAYGVLARFDRRELATKVTVTVWGPDEDSTTARTANPEDPGPYTFPPIAATITSAARLMLALLERLVTDAGGTYAFCDTDSMAIVATARGGSVACPSPDGSNVVRALDRATVNDILARFSGLNPYPPNSEIPLWKAEHDSLEHPLTCYAISAKRYLLFRGAELVAAVDNLDDTGDQEEPPAGEPELTDWSEHGLGMYLAPEVDGRGRPLRDTSGRRIWLRTAWQWVLDDARGRSPSAPPWADSPALTRFTISSPTLSHWFSGRDRSLAWADRMHPGGFGMLAHPAEDDGARRMPAASFEPRPTRWAGLDWYDRHSGRAIDVTTADPTEEPERFATSLASGALRIRTLGEALARYRGRPEHKSLAPDGSPADAGVRGLMRRRPVHSIPAQTLLTGKEGNKLVERELGLEDDPRSYRTDYGLRQDPWERLVVPVLRRMGVAALLDRGLGSASALRRAIFDGARPLAGRELLLVQAAVGFARESLLRLGFAPSSDPHRTLASYLEKVPEVRRLCRCGCGRHVTGRAIWATEACRKRSERKAKVRLSSLASPDGRRTPE